MKNIILFAFILYAINLHAQVFETAVGMGTDMYINEVIKNKDGGYILLGGIGNTSVGEKHIIKLDSAGNVAWARKYSNGFQCASLFGEDYLGIYDIRDSFGWNSAQYGELSLFDSDGMFVSAITIPESLLVREMHPTADGGSIAIGSSQSWQYSQMLMKTDSTGNFEWIKYVDSVLTVFQFSLSDIIQANAGGYIGIGNYFYPDTFNAPHYNLLVRLNNLGDTIWTKSYEAFGEYKIFNATENGFLLLTSTRFALLDSVGNLKWIKEIQQSSVPYFFLSDFEMTSDSNFIFSAEIMESYRSPCLLKVDTAGNFIWMHKYQTTTTNNGYELTICHDGGYAVSSNCNGANRYLLLIKTDSTGVSVCDSQGSFPVTFPLTVTSTPTYYGIHPVNYPYATYPSTEFPVLLDSSFLQFDYCVIAGAKEIQTNDLFLTISPNPTTGQFVISSTEFADKNSFIEIFNTLGEKTYTAAFSEGATFTCELFPPGIYFVRLSDSEKQLTQKLVVE